MKLVVGLGNPGSRYEATRHNVGFHVVDCLCKMHGVKLGKSKYKALTGEFYDSGEKVMLVKPQTYMNLSGEAVAPLMAYNRIDPADLIVIYDDMDLESGRVRVRPGGGSGGHNGMKSIIASIGSENFPRVRIGIGRPAPGVEVVEYVLEWFPREELTAISEAVQRAAEAVEEFLSRGINSAMNKYNT